MRSSSSPPSLLKCLCKGGSVAWSHDQSISPGDQDVLKRPDIGRDHGAGVSEGLEHRDGEPFGMRGSTSTCAASSSRSATSIETPTLGS